jgi:RecB family exonuclease
VKHSEIGASSSKRWFECPASVKLSEGVERSESVYAAEGTAAHELAEKCLVENKDAKTYLKEEINGFKVTQEMAEAVQVYVDDVERRRGAHGEVSVEERFSLDWIDPELFGTNDCCIIDPLGRLTILDYKHGKGIPVEADGNPQLLYYALGAARGIEVSEITLVVVQPRCDHPNGYIREWTITPEYLKQFEDELIQRVNDVKKARKAKDVYKFTKAGNHCRFCPAAGFCKTLKEEAYATAAQDFEVVEVTEETLPKPSELTGEQIEEILNKAPLIEGFVKAVREYAHSCMDKGVKVPGYKLVKKRSNRKWGDEGAVIEEFSPLFGDEIYEKKILTPAKLEKIVGKEAVKEFTITPDSGNTMAKEDDKRPAVNPAIIDEFTNI